ncbi:Hypothetical protein NG00_01822 [Corynebacterium camporealensis]|uniref:Uncharacterized protein n=1 Tax=Corynebacterium camporealensis TaxID=161896 RepID=A0A0F6QZQ3_9CORY|nr:hypothetical protein [Corynebacterium camporealensis]AKE39968.1 hypothetical protein UL81_10170 [Corynebacterium camporealensis]AVH89061.1 Hypothetical protein NG00_01822 [Corynebacterium camporealensis]
MDLSIIQVHLDNFIDTWEAWKTILSNIGDAVTNLSNGFDALTTSSAADWFPETRAVVESQQAE